MNNAITKLGEELYIFNTGNGQQAISIEVATMMTITELEAILHYSCVKDIDFEADVVALDSIRNCCIALAEKDTIFIKSPYARVGGKLCDLRKK